MAAKQRRLWFINNSNYLGILYLEGLGVEKNSFVLRLCNIAYMNEPTEGRRLLELEHNNDDTAE